MYRSIAVVFAIGAVWLVPQRSAAQSPPRPDPIPRQTVSAAAEDLAALLVYPDAPRGGYRAQLATHRLKAISGTGPVSISAVIYLPAGDTVASRGLLAFMIPSRDRTAPAGSVRMRWSWGGADTLVTLPTSSRAGNGELAFAAEVDLTDLRFLALAGRLEALLPDGTTAAIDSDLRRRLDLLTRIAGMSTTKRDELVAYTRALDAAVRGPGDR